MVVILYHTHTPLTHTQSVEFDISSSQDPDACIDTNEGRRKRRKASVALRSILV